MMGARRKKPRNLKRSYPTLDFTSLHPLDLKATKKERRGRKYSSIGELLEDDVDSQISQGIIEFMRSIGRISFLGVVNKIERGECGLLCRRLTS